MPIRKSVRELTDSEKQSFVDAIWALKGEDNATTGISTYDQYVVWHDAAMNNATPWVNDDSSDPVPTMRNSAHRGPSFLPWHREFLRRFELDLQRVGNDSNLTIPYWDWEIDPTFPDMLGGNGKRSVTIDINGRPTLVNAFFIVTDGPFGVEPSRIFDLTSITDPTIWKTVNANGQISGYLQRSFGEASVPIWDQSSGIPVPRPVFGGNQEGPVNLPSKQEVDDVLTIQDYDKAPWDEDVDSFRNILEGWWRPPTLHNRVHVWVGGSMGPGTSPNDPIFFLHHCNIDRIWAEWEKQPQSGQYEPQSGGPPGHNFDDLMFPWDGVELPETVMVKDAIPLGNITYSTPPLAP